MKKIVLFVLMLALFAGGCSSTQTEQDKLQVTASFYPMAEFARAIGGDRVQVTTLVPDGAEPHDWEPSPRDLTKIGRSQIFVYNGLVEPWAEQALQAVAERKVVSVQAGSGMYENNGRQDPHVWISPKKAAVEVERITVAFCEADASNSAYYKENSRKYLLQLQELDRQMQEIASTAQKKVFITSHAAFGHLAGDYGLRQLAVSGLSPQAEPTPADLQKLAGIVRQEQVEYIFFETLSDPRIAQVLAKETGVRTAVLDPLEGLSEEGRRENLDYIKIMQRNIDNLRIALAAQ